ncbi:MAG: ATP-binding protein [Clostridia bacterium]|nr:ATP-binding protein [Clostridia bacterium]
MILSVRANNFLVFSSNVEMSLKADMRTKRFGFNVYSGDGYNILKAACVFGPNRAGKTCLVRAIKCIRDIILGNSAVNDIIPNWNTDSTVSSLGVTFYYRGKIYSYDFSYDCGGQSSATRGIVYECFKELVKDKHGNEKGKELFILDRSKELCRPGGDDSISRRCDVSDDAIFIYCLHDDNDSFLRECKDILVGFASSIDVVNLDDISLDKTIKIFKYNKPIKERVLRLIKMSGLYIDDFKYMDESADVQHQMTPGNYAIKYRHDVAGDLKYGLDTEEVSRDDYKRLYAYYDGVREQIALTGSAGTKKLIALASYIIDSLDNGRVLVVDEMDSSLHITLIRALVTLFNCDSNYSGQLIFTLHNIMMMDCRTMFRKDQICFVNRNRNDVSIYSLADFTSLNDKIRSESDLLEKYLSGFFNAIPDTDYLDLDDDIPESGDSYEQ